MKKILAALASCMAFATQAWAAGLIVVEDLGGASAFSCYQGLDPRPSAATPGPGDLDVRGSGAFPVRSVRLLPGQVQGRAVNTPGLQPLFLVGNDTLSRIWLKERGDELRGLHAVSPAVNVANEARLTEIRAWGKGLQILSAPADDLVDRFGLRHYPALTTPAAIQQQESSRLLT